MTSVAGPVNAQPERGAVNKDQIVVIGAGIGGLTAAALLAARGVAVTVVEKEAAPGGKLRQLSPAGRPIDAGPTVFTMRWVFDEIFAAAGETLDASLALDPLPVLARHAWPDGSRLDLFADPARSAEAIAALAGAEEGRRFLGFAKAARETYEVLETPFLRGSKTSPIGLSWRIGFHRIAAMQRIRPFSRYWQALGRHFRDPRLRQLFGRYATYNGASPFLAPSTLMLIAHVEQAGVWSVRGGMHGVAQAVAGLATRHGAVFRFGQGCARIETEGNRVSGVILDDGTRLPARAIIANADPSAIATGLFGGVAARVVSAVPPAARSLSALCWVADIPTTGFPLHRHNVFFSPDYAAEFEDLDRHGRPPTDSTVYLCAQDRDAAGEGPPPGEPERIQIIVNAPARGDTNPLSQEEITRCQTQMLDRLQASGLTLGWEAAQMALTHPAGFEALFPATGGALYGRATHGWAAAFRRPGARTAMPGLYLAGGATHPGAGVPMAALSGCRAAESVLADLPSTRASRRAAMPGGMSTRSAKTAATG